DTHLLMQAQEGLDPNSEEYLKVQAFLDFINLDDTRTNLEDQLMAWEAILTEDEAAIEEMERIISNPNNTSSTRNNAKEIKQKYEEDLAEARTYIDALSGILHTPQNAIDSLDERLEHISADELKDRFSDEEILLLSKQVIDSDATIQELEDLLCQLQNEADENPVELKTTATSALDGVHAISGKLRTLTGIYDDIQDGGDFDWSSVLNNEAFEKAFQDAGDIYDDFIETVTSHSDDIDACQNAFDRLATSALHNSDIFEDLTDETKDATIAMLEQSGITNAANLVNTRLSASNEYLALTQQNLKDATWQDIGSLLSLNSVSSETAGYLSSLALQKMNVNNMQVNTKSDIDNIIAIANASGMAGGYVNALRTALLKLQNAQAKSVSGAGEAVTKTAQVAFAKVEVNKILEDIQAERLNASDFYAKVGNTGAVSTGSASSAATQAAQETTETFNWLETLLSRIQRKITNFGKTVSAVWQSWSKRNNAAIQQLAAIQEELTTQQQAYDA
ncbi:MAG: hypothetical protein K2O73_04845, partial [Lachnospiraceae bacterium]|nr:hypothetical protein [Lachnospiraceae bacterium]